ncbi:hypothetical protein EDD36DRAFT_488132 [Exophiala viscosa]|uniref:FAD/NAD(P)-binding domain-containing protein n=1 Tax=Exophiala viscosa TaxID=2486360 RepID=A0AAN6ID51_9EURO|nr:hypothetical protein EDD36DRAFT_488132 [Exophiala viscosa]
MVSDSRPLYDRPIDANRKIKVVCLGAGYSGILTAIRFPQHIPNLELVIYEKNADIGGTWYENRYPGIACDIPSHVYQFTFESNPNWSRFYATGGEIQEYLKDVAWKYDVEKYVRFRHYFQRAEWDESIQQWRIEVTDLNTNKTVTDTCDILLKGTGLLNTWKWPDIPGLHDFKGPYMHSANWDSSFDWTDKRVALIGAGSSGIQILPNIQPKAKQVVHFMKGKTWISPVGYGAEEEGESDGVEISEEQRKVFRENPSIYQKYRHQIEGGMNKSQLVTFRDTDIQKLFWKMSDDSMKEKLKKKPWIYESMRPDYPPGCRRLTPGPGYLEALVEDNVEFVGTGIRKVTETGLVDDNGDFHEVDAIIYATGFDYSFNSAATPIIGRGGKTLEEVWTPHPEAYLSLCAPKMPNLFFFLGPNGGPGAGSFIAMLENVVDYVIQCVQKLQREYVASMEVSETAQKAFSEHVDRYFAKTIFTYKCKSWFKRNNEDGRIVGLWPGSSVHAQEALKSPRFEDFLFVQRPETQQNILTWLGNGMTTAQENDEKTTGYLDTVDVPPAINKGPRPGKKDASVNGHEDGLSPHGETEVKVVSEHIEELTAAVATVPL